MRGRDVLGVAAGDGHGITPAYAGKRLDFIINVFTGKDHPRVCGEESSGSQSAAHPGGSPPRMRGRGVHHRDRLVAVGITPAYAGKR